MEIEAVKCEFCPYKYKWRLVEEELPKKEDFYLVTTEINGRRGVISTYYNKNSAFWNQYVVAWMPFPKVAETE